jgi:hypothetical protein
MQQLFIKKYCPEQNTIYYVHFSGGRAVRQIEHNPDEKIFLSEEHPQESNSILYDLSLDLLEAEKRDFITEREFEKEWEMQPVFRISGAKAGIGGQ